MVNALVLKAHHYFHTPSSEPNCSPSMPVKIVQCTVQFTHFYRFIISISFIWAQMLFWSLSSNSQCECANSTGVCYGCIISLYISLLLWLDINNIVIVYDVFMFQVNNKHSEKQKVKLNVTSQRKVAEMLHKNHTNRRKKRKGYQPCCQDLSILRKNESLPTFVKMTDAF